MDETFTNPNGPKDEVLSPIFPKPAMRRLRHPTYQVMVDKALIALNQRAGSSVQAIKKYVFENFRNLNKDRLNYYIYKYIKNAVNEGKIKQTKRKFKLVKVKQRVGKISKATIKKPTTIDHEKPRTKAEMMKEKFSKVAVQGKSTKISNVNEKPGANLRSLKKHC